MVCYNNEGGSTQNLQEVADEFLDRYEGVEQVVKAINTPRFEVKEW